MKLVIDSNECAAFGICVGIIPDVIKLDDGGYAYTENDGDVPSALEDAARAAVRDCPSNAIQVTDPSSIADI